MGTTSLFRHDGRGNFAYVDANGEWRDRPELLMKVREEREAADLIDV